MKELVAEAVSLMIQRAPTFKDAKSLSVRLLYAKAGGVDQNYGTDTIAGIDRIATVTAPVSALLHGAGGWPQALRAGKTIPALTVTIESTDATP
jgi:hypothetical protein